MAGEIIIPGGFWASGLVHANRRLVLPRLKDGALLTSFGKGICAAGDTGIDQMDNVAASDYLWEYYSGTTDSSTVNQESTSVNGDFRFRKKYSSQHRINRNDDASAYRYARYLARYNLMRKMLEFTYPGPEAFAYGEFPSPVRAVSESDREFFIKSPYIFYSDGVDTYVTSTLGCGRASLTIESERPESHFGLAFPGADPGARVHATATLRSYYSNSNEIIRVRYVKGGISSYTVNPFIDVYAAAGEVWNNQWPEPGGESPQFVHHETAELGAFALPGTVDSNNYTRFNLSKTAVDFVFTIPKTRAVMLSGGLVRDVRQLLSDLLSERSNTSGFPLDVNVRAEMAFDIVINSIGN